MPSIEKLSEEDKIYQNLYELIIHWGIQKEIQSWQDLKKEITENSEKANDLIALICARIKNTPTNKHYVDEIVQHILCDKNNLSTIKKTETSMDECINICTLKEQFNNISIDTFINEKFTILASDIKFRLRQEYLNINKNRNIQARIEGIV